MGTFAVTAPKHLGSKSALNKTHMSGSITTQYCKRAYEPKRILKLGGQQAIRSNFDWLSRLGSKKLNSRFDGPALISRKILGH